MRFIVLIFLVGCSFIDEPFLSVDSRLKVTVDQFIMEANQRNFDGQLINLSIRIGKIEDTGVCVYHRGYTEITINESFFTNGMPDSLALQYIVFHELGHYFGRDHNATYSIMNPNKYAGEYRNNYQSRTLLIDELFDGIY